MVYNNMLNILLKLYQVPDLAVPTFRNSIQFEWKNSNGSYLEFEVYEDMVTMLLIPYEKMMKKYNRFDLYDIYSRSRIFKLHEITDMNILLTNFLDEKYDWPEIKKIIKEEQI